MALRQMMETIEGLPKEKYVALKEVLSTPESQAQIRTLLETLKRSSIRGGTVLDSASILGRKLEGKMTEVLGRTPVAELPDYAREIIEDSGLARKTVEKALTRHDLSDRMVSHPITAIVHLGLVPKEYRTVAKHALLIHRVANAMRETGYGNSNFARALESAPLFVSIRNILKHIPELKKYGKGSLETIVSREFPKELKKQIVKRLSQKEFDRTLGVREQPIRTNRTTTARERGAEKFKTIPRGHVR